jgi:hypothetical protein
VTINIAGSDLQTNIAVTPAHAEFLLGIDKLMFVIDQHLAPRNICNWGNPDLIRDMMMELLQRHIGGPQPDRDQQAWAGPLNGDW